MQLIAHLTNDDLSTSALIFLLGLIAGQCTTLITIGIAAFRATRNR